MAAVLQDAVTAALGACLEALEKRAALDAERQLIDRTLRAEAVAILRRLDELDPPTPEVSERS